MPMKKLLAFPYCSLVILCLYISSAHAENEHSYFNQTMGVNLGYFFTNIDNNAQLSGTLTGSDLNFETDLGLNSHSNTFKSDIFWRITPKHRLDFTWFGLFQNGQQLSNREITIGDHIIPAGTGLQSNFNLNRYQFTYTYNLFQGDNFETGPSLGVYTININSNINSVVANSVKTNFSSTNIALPLPTIGWRGSYGLTNDITLHSHFNFMIVSIDEWKGDLYDFQLAAEYNFLKYMGIGMAYNLSFLEVNHIDDNSSFKYNYDFQGVQTYIKFAF